MKDKIYRLLSMEKDVDVLGCWRQHTKGHTRVVGYSVTGTIFLRNPETNEYMVLYPSRPGHNSKSYGRFADTKDFEKKILKDEDFPRYGLYPITPEDLPILVKRLGPCEEDQIYYPVPDPAIGGTGALDTFQKGNIWTHAVIAGQNRGL